MCVSLTLPLRVSYSAQHTIKTYQAIKENVLLLSATNERCPKEIRILSHSIHIGKKGQINLGGRSEPKTQQESLSLSNSGILSFADPLATLQEYSEKVDEESADVVMRWGGVGVGVNMGGILARGPRLRLQGFTPSEMMDVGESS